MRRFHRGAKEWRLYTWDHVVHHEGPGTPWYEVRPLLNTKNSKRRNKKNNRKLQSITVKKGTRLYKALACMARSRGGIKTDALFPQP